MKKLITLAIIILHANYAFSNLRSLPTAQLLDTLDSYVQQVDRYDKLARGRISARKRSASELPASARPAVYREIGQLYLHVDIDSALHYFELGRELAALTGNECEEMRLQLAQLRVYPYKGLLYNALKEIERINPDSLPPELKTYYYGSRHHIFRTARDVIDNDTIRERYTAVAVESIDSLLRYLRPDHPAHLFFSTALALSQSDNYHKEVYLEHLRKATDTMNVDYSIFAISTAMLARVSEMNGYTDDAIRFLAISAISDIKHGNAEGTSLQRLGRLLYQQGDTERAYRYLTMSLERSVAAGARIRPLEAAEVLPYVLDASQAIQARSVRNMYAVIAVLSLLLVAAVTVLIFQKRRENRCRERNRLRETALADRNEYIRRLLQLCVDSLEDFDRFELHVTRKLKAKQSAELLEKLNSDEHRQKRLQQLQARFDADFLALYPDFIARINRLLADDRKFDDDALHAGSLTPELRMLALLSLGVTESQDLARILGLTLNTVYTYRTRIKSRATDRATFEENVRNIGRTS